MTLYSQPHQLTYKPSKRAVSCILTGLVAFALPQSLAAADIITFEGLPDGLPVGDTYSSLGAHFQNSIALTAGISLNEIDYPPANGTGVVGDDGGPLIVTFDLPTSNVSGYFTYSTGLTISIFDGWSNLMAVVNGSSASNLGSSELISLPYSGIRSISIAGTSPNGLTLDDLRFTSASVPEPQAGCVVGFALMVSGIATQLRRSQTASQNQTKSN